VEKTVEFILIRIFLNLISMANEQKSIVFRRSLYIVQDLKAGDVSKRDNVRAIWPGLGFATKNLDVVIDKFAVKGIKKETALDLVK